MTDSRYKKMVLVFSLAGLLFSGYLSAVKLFTSTCALNEPCPYFWGYPSCWYGFAMFLVLCVSSLVGLFKSSSPRVVVLTQVAVSALGMLFAGYFTLLEVGRLLAGNATYSLGLPSCAYGFIFYATIFSLAVFHLKHNPTQAI